MKPHRHMLLRFKCFRFRNLSITVKLFLCFGLTLFFIILLSTITFLNYKNDKENTSINIVKQMNNQTIDKIDQYFMDLNSISKMPLFDTDNFTTSLELFNKSNVSDLDFQNKCSKMFSKIFNYKPQIHSVFIFSLKGKSEYKLRGSSLYKDYNPVSEKWFMETVNDFGKPNVVNTFVLPNVADMYEKPVYVFSMSRGLVSVENSKVEGVILINTKVDFLKALCEKMIITQGQRILIVDKTGIIVYDTINNNIMNNLPSNILNESVNVKENTKKIQLDDKEVLLSYTTSLITDWKIINIIPSNELNKDLFNMRNNTIIITLIVIIIIFVLVLFISMQIVKPVKKLSLLMKLFQKGDFDVQIALSTRDEIGKLAKSFNNMTRKIKKLIHEDYINKIKQKDLEFQMLQNQINPHFLYNTLDSIHMMAEINNDPETSQMATSLGRILKYGINRIQDNVTVQEEVEHLYDYIMLQKVRFEDIFTISMNIEPDIKQCIIIKLILQPLVENAIYHGLNKVAQGGQIEVLGYRHENTIIFEVTDNGGGIDNETVDEMNKYINGLNSSFKSIGLKNVNRRLKLQYGNAYGLKITSQLNIGTKVTIVLPLVS